MMTNRSAPVATTPLDTPLGPMLAGATQYGICLLEFADRPLLPTRLRSLETRFGNPPAPGNHPLLDRLAAQLTEYFAGTRQDFEIPLALAGTAFQEHVWRRLLRIPYGRTVSYAELARRAGSPGGSRAVGRANGDNRIAIVVPCHRVIRANGDLGGYGGGLGRKRQLLELEGGLSQAPLF